MCVYSFASTKGGSLKTSSAVQLVHYLSLQQFSTALIDCDRQQHAASWVTKLETDTHIFASDDVDEIEDAITELETQYDAVIVDTAGSNIEIMKAAIGLSQHVLIPVNPSALDIESGRETIRQVIRARKKFKRDIEATIFLTRVVAKTTKLADTIAIFEEYEEINFSKCKIPSTQRMIKLADTHQTVFNAPGCKDIADIYTELFKTLID